MENIPDDQNPFSGACIDANGCTLFGGGFKSCGNIQHTICKDLGPNKRQCGCDYGYYGIDRFILIDADNPEDLGVCQGMNLVLSETHYERC